MAIGHYPSRSKKTGRFVKGRWRSHKKHYSGGRHASRHKHKGHPRARWRQVCGSKTVSWHRKKSAANKVRRRGCRIVRV